jgi:hypothetical protein
MRKVLPYVVLVALLPACFGSYLTATSQQKQLPKAAVVSYLPPVSFLKIAAVGYKGLVSDYLFLKVYTFYGESLHRTAKPRITKDEWHWVIKELDAATDLDPYFSDPYYFANAFLTWEARMYTECNLLLEKGSLNRDWDERIPFFAGFNYYYFLNDGLKSFKYLTEASKRSGGNPLYDSLAARAAYRANKTEFAISYLEDQIQQADLQGQKGKTLDLERRLDVLKGIRQIEVAVESYKELFGTLPTTIGELTTSGLLRTIPADPYGGSFYISSDGSVKTTSNMAPAKK